MEAIDIKNLIDSELNISVDLDEKSGRITVQPAQLVSICDLKPWESMSTATETAFENPKASVDP